MAEAAALLACVACTPCREQHLGVLHLRAIDLQARDGQRQEALRGGARRHMGGNELRKGIQGTENDIMRAFFYVNTTVPVMVDDNLVAIVHQGVWTAGCKRPHELVSQYTRLHSCETSKWAGTGRDSVGQTFLCRIEDLL